MIANLLYVKLAHARCTEASESELTSTYNSTFGSNSHGVSVFHATSAALQGAPGKSSGVLLALGCSPPPPPSQPPPSSPRRRPHGCVFGALAHEVYPIHCHHQHHEMASYTFSMYVAARFAAADVFYSSSRRLSARSAGFGRCPCRAALAHGPRAGRGSGHARGARRLY